MHAIQEALVRGDEACDRLLAGPWRYALYAFVFVLGCVSCGIVSYKLGGFNTWDMRNYQFYTPYALLNGRFGFDYAAAQIQTFLNPLPFVPFYWTTTTFAPATAGYLMGCIHGLSVGFVFLSAMTIFSGLRSLTRILFSLACTAVGAYGPTFIGMMGGSGSDNIACVFVLAGVWLLLRGSDSSAQRRDFALGGVLIGIAAGLKLVAAVFIVGAVASIFLTRNRWQPRLTDSVIVGAASVVGILISRGFWIAQLWSRFDSPLFPFYNDVFRSPYYHQTNFADTRFVPESLAAAITLPFRLFTETEFAVNSHGFRDIRYPILYCLLIAIVISVLVKLARRKPFPTVDRKTCLLLVFTVISYVAWQTKFAIMRYIVPLELLAPIAIVALIRALIPGRRIQIVAILISLISISIVTQPREAERLPWADEYVQVTIPELENPDETLIVIANDRPWSYLIPMFPPGVRFIGLDNNFSRALDGKTHKAREDMFALVNEHKGPRFLLSDRLKLNQALAQLPGYTLRRRRGKPLVIGSVHERLNPQLWPLRKM